MEALLPAIAETDIYVISSLTTFDTLMTMEKFKDKLDNEDEPGAEDRIVQVN